MMHGSAKNIQLFLIQIFNDHGKVQSCQEVQRKTKDGVYGFDLIWFALMKVASVRGEDADTALDRGNRFAMPTPEGQSRKERKKKKKMVKS